MNADSSLSTRTVRQPHSDLPVQTESESEVKSPDWIQPPRHKSLTVHIPRAGNDPIENGSERHQAASLESQHIQI